MVKKIPLSEWKLPVWLVVDGDDLAIPVKTDANHKEIILPIFRTKEDAKLLEALLDEKEWEAYTLQVNTVGEFMAAMANYGRTSIGGGTLYTSFEHRLGESFELYELRDQFSRA